MYKVVSLVVALATGCGGNSPEPETPDNEGVVEETKESAAEAKEELDEAVEEAGDDVEDATDP
jgi:hypothetical protein